MQSHKPATPVAGFVHWRIDGVARRLASCNLQVTPTIMRVSCAKIS
jgi:hypothetical protein